MESTIREVEAAFRAEGYSRREAEELTAALNTKKHEVNDMPKSLLEERRGQLAKLEDAFENLKWMKSRNEQQEKIYCELFVGIPEIRNEIAELEGRKADRPMTVEGPVRYDSAGAPIDSSIVETSAGTGRTFRAMFGHRPGERLDNGGFKDAAEFIAVMDSGRYDPRLQVRASMGEGIPSSGGFSVPSQFASEWLDASLPNEIVRNLCRVYPMESQSLEVPGWDGADMSAGKTHGGLEMVFLAEGSDATPQTAKLRKIMLVAKMGAIYVDSSIELIQDGKGFAENLQKALQSSMGYGIDRYLLTGSGTGCPQGVLSAPCKVQVTPEIGQHADTVVYGNVKKMFARALNPDKAVWLFNSTAIPELLEQSVAVGTGGSFVPLLNETNGKFTIFGRPVYFHPAMPTLGDADDCAFVDFNFYALGLRKEVWIDQTDAVRWLQRERSVRILLRFDGQCTLNAAVTPENGATLSPVVTLAART
jgi:HK97 family phage major capsid protein